MVDVPNSIHSDSKWKDKYFNSLDHFEEQEKSLRDKITILTQSILSVCRIGSEINPKLQEQLTNLRAIVRRSALDPKIPVILKELEQVLEQTAERETRNQEQSIQILRQAVEQLLALKLPYKLKRKLRKLHKLLFSDETGKLDLKSLLEDFADCQQKSLQPYIHTESSEENTDDPTNDEINNDALDLSPPPESKTIAWQEIPSATDIKNVTSETTVILLTLLEKLTVPESYTDTVKQLKNIINGNFSLEQLTGVLQKITELSLAAGQTQQSEFESFLKQLNIQLETIQQVLSSTQSYQNQKLSNKKTLKESVTAIISEINNTVHSSNTLEQLKQSIDQKLDNITSAIDTFQQNDSEHEKALQGQMQKLYERLENIETQSHQIQEKLESHVQTASTDSLTQIPNRASYETYIQTEYARWQRYGAPLSLIVGDIDYFKKINDQYGHQAGDKVLKLIAQVVRRALRVCDFVARYGGEEFVIVLPNSDKSAAESVAAKLCEAVATCPFHHNKEAVNITMSFGISSFQDNDDIETVFERADKALYDAKHQGRNQFHCR